MNFYRAIYEGGDFDEFFKTSINEYRQFRSKIKGNNAKYMITCKREVLADDNHFSKFYDLVRELMNFGLKPSDIVFGFHNNYNKKTFSQKELDNLKAIDTFAKALGVKAGVYDYDNVFDYQSVAKADKIIKEQANLIKKNGYSPLEALLHAYLLTAKFKYNDENEEFDDLSISRSVYGILNSDKIVCHGYSQYLKAIVNEIDDPNLKVFANSLASKNYDKGKVDSGFHSNNIAYIRDNKYKIDGFYYLDPTWDYAMKENSLMFFMTEIGQIKNFVGNISDNFVELDRRYRSRDYYEGLSTARTAKKYKYKTTNWRSSYHEKYASVSKDRLNMITELDSSIKLNTTDTLLSKYLLSRQDFKDYVVLYETLHNLKHSNLGFDKLLEKNAKIADEDITKLDTIYNTKALFKYLKQHSPHVDVGQMQNALQKVLGVMNPEKTKDEISKIVYETLKKNIKRSKEWYNEQKTTWTECENLKEKEKGEEKEE